MLCQPIVKNELWSSRTRPTCLNTETRVKEVPEHEEETPAQHILMTTSLGFREALGKVNPNFTPGSISRLPSIQSQNVNNNV